MNKFQIIIRKFWIRVEKPIWSFIVNCVFWLCHLNKIAATRKDMKTISKVSAIEDVMKTFRWKEDNFADWTPWIMTMTYQAYTDDCDGAAEFAKWYWKNHGVEADILNLYSKTEGHTICVTKSRDWMVTNERVVLLHPLDWEKEVMNYFGNKYEVII
jgi:hypothetical protein